MTPEQFAYWLQGYVELQGSVPTDEQWQGIKDHLQAVFVKVTPPIVVKVDDKLPPFDIVVSPSERLTEAMRKWNERNICPFDFGKAPVITC